MLARTPRGSCRTCRNCCVCRASAEGRLLSKLHPVHWIPRLALAGVLLGFCVVVLGAYVRLSAAGLGCPDWPGCYGHITPSGAQQSTAAQAQYPNRPLEA